ncbi:MAG: CPBP family intramembrane metalloprotease [bacterium]|nr:CPBP family intramembrane metalloprotease [bacterium]
MSDEDYEYEPPPPLNTGFLLVLALAAPLLQIVFFVLLVNGPGVPAGAASAGMATIFSYVLLLTACAKRIPEPAGLHLGIVIPRGIAWIAVAFLVWAILLSSETDNIVRALFPMPAFDAGEPNPEGGFYRGLGSIVTYVVVFPIAFELFFRGAMQPVLVAELGTRAGIALTAALCGYATAMGLFNPWAIVPAIMNALVLGILRHGTGSILPCLALHASWGILRLAAENQMLGIGGFDDLSQPHTSLGWLLLAGLLTGIGLRLCRVSGDAVLPGTDAETDGGGVGDD